MKNLICLIFALLFLVSCAAKDPDIGNKKEIAVAAQGRGEGYYNSGQYTAALKKLLEAYKTIPNDPYLNNSLGLVYLAKNRYDLAEIHFKKALNIKPDYIQARNNLGAAYLRQKKWNILFLEMVQIQFLMIKDILKEFSKKNDNKTIMKIKATSTNTNFLKYIN